MDIAKLIVHQARLREFEPAIVSTAGVATYGMLASAVLSAAGRLADRDLPPGSLVAIDIRDPFRSLALVLALELRGHPTASIQTAFSAEQSGLAPAAILVEGPAKHAESVRRITVEADWFLALPDGPPDFARLLAMPGFGDENALCRVVFSSGTTGVPKSTGFTSAIIQRRLSHAALTQSTRGVSGVRIATMMGASTLPGYLQPIGALATGGMVCFAANPPDALHLIRMFDVNFMTAAVVQVQALLKALGDGMPPASLRTLIITGSRASPDLLAEARARLCGNLTFAYGSTEAGLIAAAPVSVLKGAAGAVGYPMPWVSLEVVDGDDRPLVPGEEGVFRVRTDEQAHYLVEDPENRLLFRDGWFYPGDIGRIGPDGMVEITGRSIEVINRGGSIVAPDLIERVLAMRPEVKEAAAFGVPAAGGIDDIWAAIVPAGPCNEQELLRFCREKLADKAPSVIRQVASIPRTETGKIRRRQLREEMIAARLAASA